MKKLLIDGECTVSNAVEVKRKIVGALESGDGIEMDFGNISDIDISGFQLLIATVKECDARGVQCILSGTFPEWALDRAEDAGFIDGPIAARADILTLLRTYA